MPQIIRNSLDLLFSSVAVGQPLDDALVKLRSLDYEVRFKSLSELSQLKDSRAIPDIERAIEEEAEYQRPYLQSAKPPPSGACGNDEYLMLQRRAGEEVVKFRTMAARTLVGFGPPALASRLKGLAHGEEGIRMAYVSAQREAKDPEAFSLLLTEAGKKSSVQMTAYDAVIAYGDPRAIPLHLKTLKLFGHSQEQILSSAVKELARLKVKEAVPILIEYTKINHNQIRSKALIHLSQFESKEAIGPILDRLDDKDKNVRVLAMGLLEKYDAPRVLRSVLRSLKKRKEPDFQIRALWVLKKIGNKETIKAIEPLLNDPNRAVSDNAKWAIRDLSAKP